MYNQTTLDVLNAIIPSFQASVKSVMRKQATVISEANAKLQEEAKKLKYDLISSRLMTLQCLTNAELYGDKSVVEIDMHFAPSGAMIKHLFDRFDLDKDGRLSKVSFA